MNKNGYMLAEALLGFVIILLCVSLLVTLLSGMAQVKKERIHEDISTQWFYHD